MFLKKYTFQFFNQCPDWLCYISRPLLYRTSPFLPHIGFSISQKCEWSIYFSNLVLFGSLNSLEFSSWILRKRLLSIFSAIFGYFVEAICCVFDLSFFCPIDGNYHSASAFVVLFLWEVLNYHHKITVLKHIMVQQGTLVIGTLKDWSFIN